MRHWAKHILPGGAVALLGAIGACTGPSRDSADTASSGGAISAAPATDTGRTSPIAETGVVAAGSNLALVSQVRLCTGVSRPGDTFTTTVTGSVIGAHGAVIPVGSVVVGHVVDSQDSLALAFDSLAIGTVTYPIAVRLVGSAQTVAERAAATAPGFSAFRSKGRCVPERGRITVQLTTDLPLDKK
jgi:hypothetical protein